MGKNKFLLILILFTASLLLGAGCWFIDGELVRTTEYGKVEGLYNEETDTYAWLGVPYAKPPVGDLRWRAPQDPEPWDGIRDATEQCSECTQLYTPPNWIRQDFAVGSEDCLYLDIYSPKTRKKDLPVYVWIHGGSNNFGSAKQYNGSMLASRSNVVVVVVQYRLGPLGWFTHPALRKGDPLDDSGNFGTLDTIKALKWIRNNIRAFGGDPRNVLITGESAGAHNVMKLVISPLAKGLFHKAMSQSGGMATISVEDGENLANSTIEKYLIEDGKTWAEWEGWTIEEQEAYLQKPHRMISLGPDTSQYSERRYRAIIENSMDNIYICEARTGRIIEANESMQKLLGYSEEEMIGLRVFDFLDHPQDNVEGHIQTILDKGSLKIRNRRYRRKDGSIVDIEASCCLIKENGMDLLCVISRDVSDRIAREKMLVEERNRAELYLDILNHDIGNLHQGILGFVKLSKHFK